MMAGLETIGTILLSFGVVVFILVVGLIVVAVSSIKKSQETSSDVDKSADKCSEKTHT